MKKGIFLKTAALLLAVTMTLSLAGCGKSGSQSDNPAQKSTSESTTGKEVKKTKVKVMSWWDFTKSDSLKQLKEKFEAKNADIELEYIQIGTGYADKVLAIIASGGDEVPDVMMLAADKLPKFASTGSVIPLDKYIKDNYKKSLYPMVLQACTLNGKVYAVARDVTSMVVYLNKKMFEEAKVPFPKEDWTVSDFLETAKKLTKVDAGGKPLQWGYYFPKYDDAVYNWLLIFGGSYTNAEGTKSMLSTNESKEALKFLQDMIVTHKVCPTETEAKQFGNTDSAPIVAGKVAMTIGGLSMSNSFDTANPKVEFAMAPLPVNKKKVAQAFVNTWTIPKGAKNPDLAWRVLEFLSGKDGQQIALDTKMGLPASKEVDTSKFLSAHPDNKYLIKSLDYAVPFQTLVYGADYYNLVRKELELVWLNQKTVEQAVGAIDSKAADILAGKN